MDYKSLLNRALVQKPTFMKEGERFEIPEFDTEKKGNRTVIKNFRKVAEILRREEEHLGKYVVKESGTSGNIVGRELVLQGKFNRGELNKKLEDYCKRYVICGDCGKPDTKFLKDNRVLILKCEACGSRKSV